MTAIRFTEASLRGVATLTCLTILALGATLLTSLGLFSRHLPPATTAAGVLMLAVAQAAFLWFASALTGHGRQGRVARRYGLALQLQALVQTVYLLLLVPCFWAITYFSMHLEDDTDMQERMRAFVVSDTGITVLVVTALALPAVSLLVAAWRLHHLGMAPQALAAALDGSLFERRLALPADGIDAHDLLLRHLERLADRSLPGLGRPLCGSHPSITTRDSGGQVVHELIWRDCPNKVTVSLRAGPDGTQDIVVRCALRGGVYRSVLFVTPVDALAQMQHIDAHLLAPLRAQLAALAAERQRDTLRQRAVEAQLRILQAQIEPHFLFNTLANLRQLYRQDAAGGEQMLDHLIGYLRCAMDELRAETSTVRRELDLASHYLALMKIRMGERLAYTFTVPDALLEHPAPPAMLISLVENAIKHGLLDAAHGQITLTAAAVDGQLRLGVADNGAGLSSVGGSGVGLSNIRRRLEALYGNRAWLEVGAPGSGGFAATIVIPLIEETPACPPH